MLSLRVGRLSARRCLPPLMPSSSAPSSSTTLSTRYLLTPPSTAFVATRTKIWKSPFPPTAVSTTSMYETMMTAIEKHIEDEPDRIVMKCAENEKDTLTYAQLKEQAHAAASFFTKHGFSRREVAASVLPNCLEFPVLYLAVTACGGALTGTNPLFTEFELQRQFVDSNSRVVVVQEDLLDKVIQAVGTSPNVKTIICIRRTNKALPTGVHDWNDVIKTKGLVPKEKYSPEEVTLIPYSSGTTGAPKGVLLSSRAIGSVVETYAKHNERQYVPTVLGELNWTAEHQMLQMPFFHVYGFCLLINQILTGMTGLVFKRFDPLLFMGAIEKYKITSLCLVPPLLLMMTKHPAAAKFDMSSLKMALVGAAPTGNDLCEEFLKKYDIALGQGFGMSEIAFTSHLPSFIDRKSYSNCGTLLANCEMKILDIETGRELGNGEVGELCIRSPGQMSGYLNNRKATEETIVDGWIHTGDVAYANERCEMFVVDRKKELIKVKALQVAPAELEDVLLGHPLIADAAVIGVANERSGEAPKAFVIRADENLTERDVQQYIEERLTEHKWLLGGVQFVDSIPKSASGKIFRRQLRELEESQQKK